VLPCRCCVQESASDKNARKLLCRVSALRWLLLEEELGVCQLRTQCFDGEIDVTVWEQADPLGESGTGLSLFPNGLRQLERMKLGDALAEVGAKIGEARDTIGWMERLSVESSPPTRVVGMASMECTGLIYCGCLPEVSRRPR
jgi:hypothetical protein